MPTSKRTGDSKNRLNNFKNKIKKQKSMQENTQQNEQMNPNQLPNFREVPTWRANDDLSLKGIEFEKIYNSIQDLQYLIQGLFGAANAVMQRNIFDEKIDVRFEKLGVVTAPDGSEVQDYVEMTEAEQAPHKEQFKQLVTSLKANQAKAVEEALSKTGQEGVPSINDIVNVDGEPARAAEQGIVDVNGTPISSN